MDEVEVTPEDRERSKPIMAWLYCDHGPEQEAVFFAQIDEGDSDDHFIVQALARHRIEATRTLCTKLAEVTAERDALQTKLASVRREVGIKDRALHTRSLALDAMAWVWCDGGCKGGVFRFCGRELTPAMLAMIERNTERLKRWARSRDSRVAALTQKGPDDGRG